MMSSASGAGVFPLPALGEPPPPPRSRSRRVRQRHSLALVRHQLASNLIGSLNYLSSSYSFSSIFDPAIRYSVPPRPAPRPNRLSNNPHPIHPLSPGIGMPPSQVRNQPVATSQQRRAQDFLVSCADRFVSRRGRPVQPLSDDDWSWSDILPESANLNLSGAVKASGLVPIVADRVSLPAGSNTVPLLDLLPPDLRAEYSSPDRLLAAADPQARPAPGKRRSPGRIAKFHGPPAEYAKLVRRMVALGMVAFTTKPKVVNGMFGVPKDTDAIRLITDARPANDLFKTPPKVDLPTPDLLAQLTVDPSRPLYVAKVDLDNFYHRLSLPEWMVPYFALPPLRASAVGSDVARVFGADCLVYPCLTRLPMGWSHSVYLAQHAHLNLLNTSTGLRPADRITPDNDFFVDRVRHAAYIDDVFLMGHDPAAVASLQTNYIASAEHTGLVVKYSKVVRPSTDGVEVLGLELDGRRGTLGLSVPKLQSLVEETSRLLRHGYATGLELSRLVGKWTWAMLARRPTLSVFNSVYRFAQVADSRLFTLWPTCRRELQVAMGLAPLMWCSLSDRWFPDALATDASTRGLGVVAINADVDDLAAAAAEPLQLPEPDEPDPPRPHPSLLPVLSSRSRVLVSARWRDPEHINILELRAVHTALRWAASRPAGLDSRILLLVDSAVCAYALNKGRSSSRQVLRRLRSIAALVLACGLRLCTRWIPSASNPADAPSRRFDPPEPPDRQ